MANPFRNLRPLGLIVGLASILLASSGCYTTIPETRGVVLDAQTHRPVPSATVAVSDAVTQVDPPPPEIEAWSPTYPEYLRTHSHPPSVNEIVAQINPPVASTLADGSFMLPRKRTWSLIIFFGGTVVPRSHSLIVRKAGYIPFIREFYPFYSKTNLGAIYLEAIGAHKQ